MASRRSFGQIHGRPTRDAPFPPPLPVGEGRLSVEGQTPRHLDEWAIQAHATHLRGGGALGRKRAQAWYPEGAAFNAGAAAHASVAGARLLEASAGSLKSRELALQSDRGGLFIH